MADNIVFQDKESMNMFRKVIDKAMDEDVITEEEAVFVVKLVERFRKNIESRVRQIYSLKGEIELLKNNETDLVEIAEETAVDDVTEDADLSDTTKGLLVTINNRLKSELERKARTLLMLQGEIAQLKSNEKILKDIVSNIIAAHERAVERDAAMERIRLGEKRDGVVLVEENEPTDELTKDSEQVVDDQTE